MDKLTDSGLLGSYRYGGFSGIVAAGLAANAELFQFRWRDAVAFCEVRRVIISAAVSTTFFAAGVPLRFQLDKCTGWTGQGGGGTGIAPGALLKKRTLQMPSSLIASGDMRIATTAGLTAGTKTIESLSMASIIATGPITAALDGTILKPTILYECEVADGDYPALYSQNEGFIIRAAAVPATGTWEFAVSVEWNERSAF